MEEALGKNTRLVVSLIAKFSRSVAQLRATKLDAQQESILQSMYDGVNDSRLLPGHAAHELPSYDGFVKKGTTRFRTFEEFKQFLKTKCEGGVQSATLPPSFVRLTKRKAATEGEAYPEQAFAVLNDASLLVASEGTLTLHDSAPDAACTVILVLKQANGVVEVAYTLVLSENSLDNIRTDSKKFEEFPHSKDLRNLKCELHPTSSLLSNVKLSDDLLAHNPGGLLAALQPESTQNTCLDPSQMSRQLLLCLTINGNHSPRYSFQDSLAHMLCEG